MLRTSQPRIIQSTKLKHGKPALGTRRKRAMTPSLDPEATLGRLTLDQNHHTATIKPPKQATITVTRTSHNPTTRTQIFVSLAVNSLTATSHTDKQPSCHRPCRSTHLRSSCRSEVQGLVVVPTQGTGQDSCHRWHIPAPPAFTECFRRSPPIP